MSLIEAVMALYLFGVDKNKPVPAGLAYVALSRLVHLQGLYLEEFDPRCLVVNKAVALEMSRMRAASTDVSMAVPTTFASKLTPAAAAFCNQIQVCCCAQVTETE
jgi:hypothetical protein